MLSSFDNTTNMVRVIEKSFVVPFDVNGLALILADLLFECAKVIKRDTLAIKSFLKLFRSGSPIAQYHRSVRCIHIIFAIGEKMFIVRLASSREGYKTYPFHRDRL